MNQTLPTLGTCWREAVSVAVRSGTVPVDSALAELSRRHVQFEDLRRGPVYERVITLAHLGFTAPQIARAMGEPEGQIDYLLRSARSDTWRIVDEHLNGYTAQEISNLTDFSKAYVYRILKKYQFRPNVHRAPELTSRQEEEIIRRRSEGEAQRSISKATGATLAQVKYLLKRRSR